MQFMPTKIAASSSLGAAVDLRYGAVVGFYFDAWTTAAMTLQASRDNVNWFNVLNYDGTEWQVQPAASSFVNLSPLELQGARFIRPRSGTAAAAVNQVADANITIATREVEG